MPPPPVFERYAVRGVLGRGGFSMVYHAYDRRLEREVALKVLHPHIAEEPQAARGFLAEARRLARLHHPNIVTVYDVGEDDGRPYFTMEILDGQSFARLVSPGNGLPLPRVVELVRPLGAAVDYLHGRGIMHRDIKPANVQLTEDGRVMLMDLGIARVLEDTASTLSGHIVGTPEAMAPEQIRGDAVGPAVDLYALGALAYRLLSGRAPFVGSPEQVLFAHVNTAPRALRELCPDLSEPAEAAVAAALAKDPAERPATAAAFVAALTRGAATPAFIGRYPDLGRLASGGFGTVHRSYDAELGRDLALKVLASNHAGTPEVRARFLREARDLASLHHPNIVTVYDLGEAESGPYRLPFYAMELIHGGTLESVLQAEGAQSLAHTAAILAPLCSAVDYIHERGLVHRDIKAANVMLDAGGRVVLMDFGIARALEGTPVTATGTVIGSPEAMAPEQALAEPVGPAADIYALGVLAYRMLAGKPPFTGTASALRSAHARAIPPPLRTLCPDVPEAVYAVVDQALAKAPADRPASARLLADVLSRVAEQPREDVRAAQAPAEPSVWGLMAPVPPQPATHTPAPEHAPTEVARATPGPELPGVIEFIDRPKGLANKTISLAVATGAPAAPVARRIPVRLLIGTGLAVVLVLSVTVIALLSRGHHPPRVATGLAATVATPPAAAVTVTPLAQSTGATPSPSPSANAIPTPRPQSATEVSDAAILRPAASLVQRAVLPGSGDDPGTIVLLSQATTDSGCPQPYLDLLRRDAGGQWGRVWEATVFPADDPLLPPTQQDPSGSCTPTVGLFAVQPLEAGGPPRVVFSRALSDGSQRLAVIAWSGTAQGAVLADLRMTPGAALNLADGQPATVGLVENAYPPQASGLDPQYNQPTGRLSLLLTWRDNAWAASSPQLTPNCMQGTLNRTAHTGAGTAIQLTCPNGRTSAALLTSGMALPSGLSGDDLAAGDDVTVTFGDEALALADPLSALPVAASLTSAAALKRSQPTVVPTPAATRAPAAAQPVSRPQVTQPPVRQATAPPVQATVPAQPPPQGDH